MPWLFVALWSTGFVVARLAMPHAPPLQFLCWRYLLSLGAFGLWIRWAGVAWPQQPAQWGHLAVSGMLMQAGYLGGVWAAVKAGIPAGTVALIVGLQPMLTALWIGAWVQPQVGTARASAPAQPLRPQGSVGRSAGQWPGLALGLVGLLLVVWPKLGRGEVTALNLSLSLLALLSMTVGVLYQKRFVAPGDVRTGNFVQLLAALAVSLPLAWLEPGSLHWHRDLVLALIWSVLALSVGASSLLMVLIQRGAATQVTSLFYLVPPCTALLAWWIFDEPLGMGTLIGMGVCAVGVGLVLRADRA